MKLVLEQFLARALAVLWASFWLWFFVVESLYYQTPALVMTLWVAVGLCFALATVVAWRREYAGGALLALLGVAAGVVYALRPPPDLPLRVVILTTAMFSVPPLAAGVLFMLHQRQARRLR